MDPTSSPARKGALLALAVVSLAGGCGGSVYDTMSGEEVYRRLCAQCHGPRGRAMGGVGNSFVEKRQYWTEETLAAYLADPKAYRKQVPHLAGSTKIMPALNPNIPTATRDRLVEHVLGLMDDLAGPRK